MLLVTSSACFSCGHGLDSTCNPKFVDKPVDNRNSDASLFAATSGENDLPISAERGDEDVDEESIAASGEQSALKSNNTMDYPVEPELCVQMHRSEASCWPRLGQ